MFSLFSLCAGLPAPAATGSTALTHQTTPLAIPQRANRLAAVQVGLVWKMACVAVQLRVRGSGRTYSPKAAAQMLRGNRPVAQIPAMVSEVPPGERSTG